MLCSIGFNSVYHLTDLPSFATRENVVIFDPHCEVRPAPVYEVGLGSAIVHALLG